MKIFEIIKKIIGISIFLIIILTAYKWMASTNEIKLLCSQFSSDQPMSEVFLAVKNSRYAQTNMSISQNSEGFIIIHSTANFGRQTCDIDYKDNKVIQAISSFLD